MSNRGFSSGRLAHLHSAMARHIECGAMPGLVTLISRYGDTHVDAIGHLAVGSSRDTIFRIASLTKPVVAAAIMVLVERCRLRLDESVEKWLPELANRRVLKRIDGPLDETVPAVRAITVRDLLTYCFGFGSAMC